MTRAERYEVVETIQEGMTAVTYKAHDRVLDRPVLLKVLNPRLAADSDLVQRFRREALLQARLKHPGIVTIYDYGTEDDFYIASEFIEGRTLEALLTEKGRLTLAVLTPIVREVARALAFAHNQGVVHRDLKPANIMISDSGEVKLTDFGLACARDLGDLTQEGCVIGTPSYMSPEQARGLKVDTATDIFALGIIIYQALGGNNPFAAATYADALSLVLNHEPRALAELVPGLPGGLSEFVGRMLSKRAADRPGSAQELVRLFSAPTTAARQVRPQRRAVLAAVLAPAIVAAVVVPIVLAHTQRRPRGLEVAARPMSDTSQNTASVLPNAFVTVPETSSAATQETEDPTTRVSGTRILEFSNPRPLPNECRLRLLVTPWAHVAIDGRSLGTTPLATEPILAPGRHTVTLRHPRYPEVGRTVELDRPNCTLAVNLDREVAELDIRVTPWAVLAIDGQVVDTTPMDRPIRVVLGNHGITLTHPELGVRRESLHIDSARIYRLTYDLYSRSARNMLGGE
ncbi:PEGA domain-containing protein [candidate division WOR-3 bacterium]|uniref:non-specific serine/threonine protein kinase n=1 Tax=candidate division WOR-3 bacterium TaxID=2052148 RepID=A0A937XGD6_UNCW3|nr:PEGA domain-containing protein [candidate division WOR-3 bacterium]